MKKMSKIIMILILLTTMTACGQKNNVESDAAKFKKEYTEINGEKNSSGKLYRKLNIEDDNPMVYSTMEEIVEKIKNKETFVVYFGFAKCPWCRTMIEELIKSAKDNNQKTVYYVDVLETRDKYELDENNQPVKKEEGDEFYSELISLMDNVLADYTLTTDSNEEIKVGEKRIYAPNVVAVVDGKAEKVVEGVSSKVKDPYGEITDEMKEESYKSLKCIWECLNDKPVCKKNAC